MERTPPLREFLCSDTDTRDILRDAREVVLVGEEDAVAATRDALRRYGYRIHVGRDAMPDTVDSPVDIVVVMHELAEDSRSKLFAAARAKGAAVWWLGRGIGDPALALAAYRAGFAVIFHRDPAEEYRMHFDDVELGYVAPGGA